jgi:hypothetical protein
MRRQDIARRDVIIPILSLQIIPLLLFPPESFSPNSQEWWLPVFLAILVVVAVGELFLRRSQQAWPWTLMIFSQGFNIISRIMMLWPHATKIVGGATVFNVSYVSLTLLAMGLSAVLIWYLELPEVRLGLFRN